MNGPVKMNAEMNLVQCETGFTVVDDFVKFELIYRDEGHSETTLWP